MTPKERLRKRLIAAREFTERLLQDFHTPEEWTQQVCHQTNHALWIAGHLALMDNFFLSQIAPDKAEPRDEYQLLFGVGSHPVADPDQYPAAEEVLAYLRQRRAALMAAFDEITEEGMSAAAPAGSPDFLNDVGAVFETAVWHEGMHTGQLSVVRRSLGHEPINAPQPQT
ncbi:DinB family protein [Blastopirellula sp. JC732]|uniref:DinB family protein n=1 Tax=Blastopirellula sediminis TaxID=2894196 RepID=A0A9X1SG08_9BACT|nr:DinB family protein [Blastopirellula sediminis]MCC9608801.1 DinB family protein [Blastopirellula sediminis]MCC9628422.1 DinB family protein [Blastopirellula sediminis]